MRGPKPKPKPKAGKQPELSPPSALSPTAKAEWVHIVGILSGQRVLDELDIAALTIYATSYAMYQEAQTHINAHGSVVAGTTGTPIKNPYLTVQKEAWERIRPLLAEFGLTPSARARLQMGKADDAGDLEF